MSAPAPAKTYDLRFVNPLLQRRQLLELGEANIAWDIGFSKKHSVEIVRWMNANFGALPWTALRVGKYSAVEWDYTCADYEPLAVYPTWDFGAFDLRELQDYIENPWGRRTGLDPDLGWWEKPVWNQPHRVVIRNLKAPVLPDEMQRQRHRKKLLKLREIQQLYPEVEFFLHNVSVFDVMFGLDFTASSLNLTAFAQHGIIALPNGKLIGHAEAEENAALIRACGFAPDEAFDYVTHFNILSARYAAHHWNDPTMLCRTKRRGNNKRIIDTHSPTALASQPVAVTAGRFPKDLIKESDQITCDACTLWRFCNKYKKGSVCTVTSEGKKLAEMAQSKDAGVIVDMLASITAKQAERVDRALQNEQFSSEQELDPQIDKMLNNLFKNGVQLAKLRDPSLGRPLVQVNTINAGASGSAAIVAGTDPRTMVAAVVESLEAKGIARADITPEMMEEALGSTMKEIEGTVVEEGE